jgi:hypothetical protein
LPASLEKGYTIGSELGFIQGCCNVWKALAALESSTRHREQKRPIEGAGLSSVENGVQENKAAMPGEERISNHEQIRQNVKRRFTDK